MRSPSTVMFVKYFSQFVISKKMGSTYIFGVVVMVVVVPKLDSSLS